MNIVMNISEKLLGMLQKRRLLAFKSKMTIPLAAIDDIIPDPLIIRRTISWSLRILGTSFGNYHSGTFIKKAEVWLFSPLKQ